MIAEQPSEQDVRVSVRDQSRKSKFFAFFERDALCRGL